MAKRPLSVTAILERRRKEDDALRAGIAEIDAQIVALTERRAELVRALGGAKPEAAAPSAPPTAAAWPAKCADCGASVTSPPKDDECPSCGGSPFETA